MAQERLNVILQMITSNFKSEARGVSGSLNRMRGDFSNTDKSARMLEQGFSRVGKAAGLAIAGAAAGAVAVFTREMVQSVKAFAEFDSAMTQSLAIMGDVSGALRGEMSDAAREVGRTTLFSAKEAADSYFFLASAGLDAAQSISAMPQVAAFAQAGMFDMARATDLLTDAQSALGLKSADAQKNLSNMARVSDVLVKANTLANASVEQFSSALTNKAGAALRALNKDVEEGVAVLAAFADQGVKGEEAGTQFAIVLRDLQTKALQNKDAFEAAGVAVFDAAGNMNNMADIIGNLEVLLGNMSDAEKKSTLLNLGFADKSVSAITALLGTSDAIRTYEASLRSAAGVTQDVADRQLESLAGQWELVKSKIQDTRIEVGEQMAPALRDLIPQIEAVVGHMGEFAVAIGPSVASGLGALMHMLEGTTIRFFDLKAAMLSIPGQIGLGGFNLGDLGMFGAETAAANIARQQSALMNVMAQMRRMGDNFPGVDTASKLTNALIDLEINASLTEDSVHALGRAFGATDQEIIRAAKATRDWIHANKEDIPTDELEAWILEIQNGIWHAQELDRWRRQFPEIFGAAGDAAGDAAPEIGEFGDELGKSADEAYRLADALSIAAEAQQSLADQILRFINPVFNALSAMDGLAAATKTLDDTQKDSESSAEDLARAILDVALKGAEAQSAIDALGDGTDALDALALAMDKPRQAVIDILETLGLMVDGKWPVVVDVELRITEQRQRESFERQDTELWDTITNDPSYPGTRLDSISGAQHQGGFVEAGSRQHVLANEVFVPAQNGFVFPNMPTTQEGDLNLTVHVPDTQSAVHVQSLIRQNHSLTRGGLKGGAR